MLLASPEELALHDSAEPPHEEVRPVGGLAVVQEHVVVEALVEAGRREKAREVGRVHEVEEHEFLLVGDLHVEHVLGAEGLLGRRSPEVVVDGRQEGEERPHDGTCRERGEDELPQLESNVLVRGHELALHERRPGTRKASDHCHALASALFLLIGREEVLVHEHAGMNEENDRQLDQVLHQQPGHMEEAELGANLGVPVHDPQKELRATSILFKVVHGGEWMVASGAITCLRVR
mmetsp:Transcript_19683/g.75514  ORF Transcript_19683/g.75514 Transcript_19683/m.75514 type:complete len:235 (+) Transcript_19683:719-1423(+)